VIKRIQRELRKHSDKAQASRNETLDAQSSEQMSGALREAFDWLRSAAPGVALLRIVLPQVSPGDIMELQQLAKNSSQRSAFILRACDVTYMALLTGNEDAQTNAVLERVVSELFSRVEAKNGGAALLHAPRWLKDRINVWGTKHADFPLMQRVKQAFDPHHIFAPGRFVGGI
jgi:glycolate oxidase FAD binding subunit